MISEKMSEWIITILLRAVLGILCIHFLNIALIKYGYPTHIGINLYSIPIVSILGMPGIGLLYILAIFW